MELSFNLNFQSGLKLHCEVVILLGIGKGLAEHVDDVALQVEGIIIKKLLGYLDGNMQLMGIQQNLVEGCITEAECATLLDPSSCRLSCCNVDLVLTGCGKVYARGWLNYYGIASMKNNIDDINGWLYHRIRMCIWKQWKKPRTKYKNLVKLGIPEHYAATIANSRRKYWYISNNKAVIWALNKERLINSGFYDLATAYQSVHVNY